MIKFRTRHSALALAVAGVLFGGAGFAATLIRDTDNDVEEGELQPVPPVANTRDAVLFLRIGLGADTLSASGVRAAEVPDLMGAVLSERQRSGTNRRAYDKAVMVEMGVVQALRRTVRSGQGTAQDVGDLGDAKTRLRAAETARDGFLDSLRTAALDTLDPNEASTLATVWSNRSWMGIPTEFLVANMSQREWVTLRDDLAAERIAAKEGVPCPAEAAGRLAECRAVSQIATAKVNLNTYHASVQTAWNTAVQ